MYDDLKAAYHANSDLPGICLGGIIVNDQLINDAPVHLLLRSFNRHGLISGATGTGKTKTVQVLCEQLSLAGIPSLVMDIKGDLSGLAMPGDLTESIQSRCNTLKIDWMPIDNPVEFLTLSELQPGSMLRSTVYELGPLLFSRLLGLNDTQEGIITVLFHYAKAEKIPLIDLADMKNLLSVIGSEEINQTILSLYGSISKLSLGAILRRIIELESQGGDGLFGEPAFDVTDLFRVNSHGLGYISILRLNEIQEKPQLFSTIMLRMLSDVYKKMPELGDTNKPRLAIFFDESHLLFSNATKALLNLLDTVVKLIRSKGISLIFCTQTPSDLPESVLSQLGFKIQHALRAFTPKDRKNLKLIAQNFPYSDYYPTEQLLTSLKIGEALITAPDENGQPTPLIQCRLRPPQSRMGILTASELTEVNEKSQLTIKYAKRPSRLTEKNKQDKQVLSGPHSKSTSKESKVRSGSSIMRAITKNVLFRQIVRQIVQELMRSLFFALGIKKK